MIRGKKRHILVNAQGLPLGALAASAEVQDRDGGIVLLSTLFGLFPFLKKLFVDSAYQGPKVHDAPAAIPPNLDTQIVIRRRPRFSSVWPRSASCREDSAMLIPPKRHASR